MSMCTFITSCALDLAVTSRLNISISCIEPASPSQIFTAAHTRTARAPRTSELGERETERARRIKKHRFENPSDDIQLFVNQMEIGLCYLYVLSVSPIHNNISNAAIHAMLCGAVWALRRARCARGINCASMYAIAFQRPMLKTLAQLCERVLHAQWKSSRALNQSSTTEA